MREKRKGFTLIELLSVIVILAVIALIATPIVLNIIKSARNGATRESVRNYVKAINLKLVSSLVDGQTYDDRDDYIYDEIKVDVEGNIPTSGIYEIKNGKVIKGTFCIDNKIATYNDGTVVIGENCNDEDLKLPGSVKLSKTVGLLSYPETDTFEVIENISGGELTCASSDEEVATCIVSGTTVTVETKIKEGTANITVTSKESSKYKETKAVYVVTTSKGLLSYTANGYTGVYDGESHGITVISSGSVISYSSDEINYSSENPTYINAGVYTTYFKIEKEGYNTITGSKTVTINKANASITAPTTKTLVYTGLNQELINAGGTNAGTIQYKLDDGTYSTNIPTAIDVGTYTVYYKIIGDNNHNDMDESSISVSIDKANGTLALSSNTGEVTYPTSTTFEIIENISGGELTCTSSDEEVVTCIVSGTTVTVIPGTKEENATLTIKSASTANYKEATAIYMVTSKLGTLSVTANDYTGVYDGESHGITVTSSGATIKYGTTEGVYNLSSSPTRIDVGTTNVYYQVSKEGYNTITGSKTITINKANGTLALSSSSGTIEVGDSTTVTATSTGPISCVTANASVATCTVLDKTITVTGVNVGTTTITVNLSSTNYTDSSMTYNVTVKQTTLADKVKLGDYIKMTPTSTSFPIDQSKTGFEYDQTINPSELNMWRVIRINSDGTIEMVSANVSSVYIYFSGQVGYKNLVGYLNEIAAAYTNTIYVKSTRHMGYNGQTGYITNTSQLSSTTAPWACSTGGSCNPTESQGGGDTLNVTDINLVNAALGTLVTNKVGTTSACFYWLTSRYYYYNSSTYWDYVGRYVIEDGSVNNYFLYGYNSGFYSNNVGAAVRPILTLKSGLQAAGTGTLDNPYVLE